jgi:hypothetical protein
LPIDSGTPLPIIQTNVPIAGFYWAAPAILICIYFYFHLYMQRLWENLSALPAFFPDGRPLQDKVYPWLLNGLVVSHLRWLQLRYMRPILSRLETGLSILLGWGVVPITLLLFWIRYLPRHDWGGTTLHVSCGLQLAETPPCG